MKRKACIITGGTLSEDFLSENIRQNQYSVLIVVDGALEVTHRIGLQPDYIVGDFDTVDQSLLSFYDEKIILRHSPEKDQTDTELAIEIAMKELCEEIVFMGATGSRLDHSLANIFLLQRLLEQKIDAVIWDESNRLYLKNKSFILKRQETCGRFVSLLPLTQKVEKVTLKGFKYLVTDRVFHREDTLGISNEITEEEATVDFSQGIFIVVESQDK